MKKPSDVLRKALFQAVAICSSAALVTGVAPVTAFGSVIKYDLPTKASSTTHTAQAADGSEYTYRHLTTAATMYAEFNVEMLGIDDIESNPKTVVGTWDAALSNSKAGIFASKANIQPDEYLSNHYYNIYAAENASKGLLPTSSKDTLFVTRNDATDLIAEHDNLPYSVYYGADLLFATTQDKMGTYIAAKNTGKSESDADYYNPVFCAAGTGTTAKMVDGEYRLANAADQIILKNTDSNGNATVQSRYASDASTYSIADDFAKVAYGTQNYILKQIAAGKTTKKTVAVVADYDSASQTYKLMNLDVNLGEIRGTGYAGHLAAGIQNTVNDLCDTLGAVDDGTEKYVSNVTAEQLAKADYVLFSDYFSDAQYSNSQQLGKDEAVSLLKTAMGSSADGRILANYPGLVFNFLYASSAESIFNYAIAQSFVYSDVLNFTDMMAYWYNKINHVSMNSMQDMLDTLCADVSLPKGFSVIGKTSSDGVKAIDSALTEGMEYYEANKATIDKKYPSLSIPTSTTFGVGRTKIAPQSYSGKALTPAVAVYTITGEKVNEKDYTVSYKNNTEVGLAKAIVTAKEDSDYKGQSFETYFKIEKNPVRDFSAAKVTLDVSHVAYTGKRITPSVTLTLDGKTISPNDYSVEYRANTNVGRATVTVVAKDGSGYTGTSSASFEIVQASNPLKLSKTSAQVKKSKVSKKAQTVSIKALKAQGAVTYKVAKKASSKISVSKKGVVTLKKGAKKGRYVINVRAAGNLNYKSAIKAFSITVK